MSHWFYTRGARNIDLEGVATGVDNSSAAIDGGRACIESRVRAMSEIPTNPHAKRRQIRRRWGCQEAIETCSKATRARLLMVSSPGKGKVRWEFRGLRCMSWKEETVTETPIYDQHGMLTLKKQSTLFATSVANLALVIGDGLRVHPFVLICNDGQTRVQKMGGCTNPVGP